MKSRKKSSSSVWIFRFFSIGIILSLFLAGLLSYTYLVPKWVSRGKLYDQVSEVPFSHVALVFGTSDRYQGRENRYFKYRIEATSELWKSGKIHTIIVSGDNRSRFYNEPQKMRAALIQQGIPKQRIICDYAGLRTLDSVVRAQKIFGANQILFVSQRFQNERAIYLANFYGISATGFNAQDVGHKAGLKTQTREIGARVKMWLDVYFLHTKPQHLGEKISLPKGVIFTPFTLLKRNFLFFLTDI